MVCKGQKIGAAVKFLTVGNLTVVAALVVGIWVSLPASDRPDPVYQGRRLSVWLNEYTDSISPRGAQSAVVGLGTNAIPALLWMLDQGDSDSDFRRSFIHFANLQPFVKLHTSEELKSQAMQAFEALKDQARPAVPDLIRICRRSSSKLSVEIAARTLYLVDPRTAEEQGIPAYQPFD